MGYKWTADSVGEAGMGSDHAVASLMTRGIAYECTVTNAGKMPGDAVVLGFVNSTDPQFPRQKLFDFERVALQSGETKTVLLTITAEHLSVVDAEGRRLLRPASFMVRVGDVVKPVTHRFTVAGDLALLEDYSNVWTREPQHYHPQPRRRQVDSLVI